MRSVLSAGSVQLPFWSAPRVSSVYVRSCSCGVRVPPPLVGVARAPRAVPVQGTGSMRFVALGVSCPVPVLCLFSEGGGGGPVRPSPCLGLGCLSPRGWARVRGSLAPAEAPGVGRGGGLLGGGGLASPLGVALSGCGSAQVNRTG